MFWAMLLYGKNGYGGSPLAEPARPQMSPMACCILPPKNRRLSPVVNSLLMAVQRPNSAGRGEGRQGGLDGTGALITGAGGIKGGGSAVRKTRTAIEAAKARAVRPWGGVSKVEIEGNNMLYIKGIGVA